MMTERDKSAAEAEFGETLRTAFREWIEQDLHGEQPPVHIHREHRLYRRLNKAVWQLLQSELVKDAAVERMVEQRMHNWKIAMKKRLTTSRKFRAGLIEEVASRVVQEWEE